jgi:zinc protease
VQAALYSNHPRAIRLKAEMVDKINYDKILEIYADRYKDAGDFTFWFVGNIELDSARALIAQYLGGLPSTKRKETWKDNKVYVRKGLYTNEFKKDAETPKASVQAFYSGECKYTQRNSIMLSVVSQVLRLVYTEKVREQEGGTYGVNVGGNLSKYPLERYNLRIVFDTDPDKKAALTGIIYAEIDSFVAVGPSQVNLDKVKEFMLKKHKEDVKENGYWNGLISEYLTTGVDMSKDYEQVVNSLTINDIRTFAAALFGQGNRVEVTMINQKK